MGLARREPWSKAIALGNVMATTQASQSWVTLHKGTSPNGWESVALPVEELRMGTRTTAHAFCIVSQLPCLLANAMLDETTRAMHVPAGNGGSGMPG